MTKQLQLFNHPPKIDIKTRTKFIIIHITNLTKIMMNVNVYNQ
ncbi:MAG TPA: hypothetical protein DCS83_02240 [Prevotella sp.]|nr:hypothetical protein [Prevotella sp.]